MEVIEDGLFWGVCMVVLWEFVLWLDVIGEYGVLV